MIESRHYKDISIKQGNSDQIEQYLSIQTKILKESNIPEEYIQKKIANLEKEVDRDISVFFLVKIANKTIGYIQLDCGDLPNAEHIGHIKMNVLRLYRSVELQKRMLLKIESQAISEDLKRLQMIVPYDFEMVNVNVSLGFRIEGKLKYYYHTNKEYRPGYLMAKIL